MPPREKQVSQISSGVPTSRRYACFESQRTVNRYHEKCLHWGHTVSNSRPLGQEDSLLSAFFFLPPYFENPETFTSLKIDGDRVDMLWVVPITSAELEYALKHGSQALDELLSEVELDPVVDEQRASLV